VGVRGLLIFNLTPIRISKADTPADYYYAEQTFKVLLARAGRSKQSRQVQAEQAEKLDDL